MDDDRPVDIVDNDGPVHIVDNDGPVDISVNSEKIRISIQQERVIRGDGDFPTKLANATKASMAKFESKLASKVDRHPPDQDSNGVCQLHLDLTLHYFSDQDDGILGMFGMFGEIVLGMFGEILGHGTSQALAQILKICERYPQVVLCSLRLERCRTIDLDSLKTCAMLSKLEIVECTEIVSLDPLCACTKLTNLTIDHILLQADTKAWTASLGGCTNLQQLILRNCGITTLNGLQTCKCLQELTIADNLSPQLLDLQPLITCEKLCRLSLTHCNNITDVGPLSKMKELEQLDLTGCSKQIVGLITLLTRTSTLKWLRIRADIIPIEVITKLKDMDVAVDIIEIRHDDVHEYNIEHWLNHRYHIDMETCLL